MRNGEQTNGALIQKKRRSKRTLSNGSVRKGGLKSGMLGSTVAATLTSGTLARVNGGALFGLSMSMAKGAGLVMNGLEALTTASKASTKEAIKVEREAVKEVAGVVVASEL